MQDRRDPGLLLTRPRLLLPGQTPRPRPDYREPKIAGNKERDARNLAALRTAGWDVLEAWERRALPSSQRLPNATEVYWLPWPGWAEGSNSRARSSGSRPARTNSIICRRNSGGHLAADLWLVAALPEEDRIAHVRAERWIPHTAAKRVLGYLQEAFDQPPRSRLEDVLLLGESGMGKSMLLEKYERANAVAFDGASGVQRRPRPGPGTRCCRTRSCAVASATSNCPHGRRARRCRISLSG